MVPSVRQPRMDALGGGRGRPWAAGAVSFVCRSAARVSLPIYSPHSSPTVNAHHPAAQLWHQRLFRRPTVRSGCCVRCCLRFVGHRNYRQAHASKPLPTACRERTEDRLQDFLAFWPRALRDRHQITETGRTASRCRHCAARACPARGPKPWSWMRCRCVLRCQACIGSGVHWQLAARRRARTVGEAANRKARRCALPFAQWGFPTLLWICG